MTDTTINDWAEAEKALGQIAMLEAEIATSEADASALITKTRTGAGAFKKKRAAKIKVLAAELEEFCQSTSEPIGPGKSRDIRHGVVGFRSKKKFPWPQKNETLLKNLREANLGKFILIEEKPDKSGIMTAHNAGEIDARKLGVRVKVVDEFYYNIETNKEP